MASYVTTFCRDTWGTLRGMNYRQLAEQIVALGPHLLLSPGSALTALARQG